MTQNKHSIFLRRFEATHYFPASWKLADIDMPGSLALRTAHYYPVRTVKVKKDEFYLHYADPISRVQEKDQRETEIESLSLIVSLGDFVKAVDHSRHADLLKDLESSRNDMEYKFKIRNAATAIMQDEYGLTAPGICTDFYMPDEPMFKAKATPQANWIGESHNLLANRAENEPVLLYGENSWLRHDEPKLIITIPRTAVMQNIPEMAYDLKDRFHAFVSSADTLKIDPKEKQHALAVIDGKTKAYSSEPARYRDSALRLLTEKIPSWFSQF